MTTQNLRLKISSPSLKLLMRPIYPLAVHAGTGIGIAASAGAYTFGLDYSGLAPVPIIDPTTAMVALLDETASVYKLASLASLLTSGLDADLQAIAALTGTGILRRTGTNAWALGSAVANSELATMVTGTFKGNVSGATAVPSDLTAAQVTAALPVSTASAKGLAPQLPNDATKYLDGTGNFTAPAGTSGALLAANNLSDVASASTSIRNLGGIDLSATVAITTTATLTTSAFGKLHLLSGTAAYTVTLPTPVSNTGALIALSVDVYGNATKAYTVTTPSGKIGSFAASIVMWASEQVILRSDGTNWVIVSSKQIPMLGKLSTSTNQASGASLAWTAVQFTSCSGDPTGLNLCYDSTNKCLTAVRAATFILSPYGYQTSTGAASNQGTIGKTTSTAFINQVFSWTGTVNAGTVYGTANLTCATGDHAFFLMRADGASPTIAAATVPASMDFTEVVPSW